MAASKVFLAGKETDFKEGDIKELEFQVLETPTKILVIKENGKFYATANKCSHYALPLKGAAFLNGRIRCPWHGACFNAKTGDIEDFPGVDSIQTYDVEVKNGEVYVTLPEEKLKNFRRTPHMCKRSESNKSTFVVVGGGPAAASCVETLRQENFDGNVIMICKEKLLPYDRPKLSKALNVNADSVLLRKSEFYQNINVDVMLGKEATKVDASARKIHLNDGSVIEYTKCLVAPGGNPRTLPVVGMDAKNIFFLRSPEDSQMIASSCTEGKRVVVVGSSFIGMEVTSLIAKKVKSIVVVGMEKVPFERVLGERIGAALQKLHEKNNVVFRMRRTVKEFRVVDGFARGVLLDSGEILESDVVIVGAGIIPNTKFVDGVKIERDQSIVVDECLKAAEDLYAAGDIARYPWSYLHGDFIRIEHWGMAHYQGKIAALNMMGKKTPMNSIPFFWTTQFGKTVKYCGHAFTFDELYFEGNPEDLKFVGYFIKSDKVVAAVAIDRDPVVAAIAELMHQGKMPSGSEIKSGKVKVLDLVGFAGK